jgi:hypothetical protein
MRTFANNAEANYATNEERYCSVWSRVEEKEKLSTALSVRRCADWKNNGMTFSLYDEDGNWRL